MGKIVDFNSLDKNKIKCDEYLNNDAYLRTTLLNALRIAGYPATPNGIKQYQRDNGFEDNGILCTDMIPGLITNYDPNVMQDILNYIQRKNEETKKVMKNDKDMKNLIIWLILFAFFELYGVVSCFLDILRLIKK